MTTDLQQAARRTLGLIDLTLLGERAAHAEVARLAASASTPHGAPAALCIWPECIGTARGELDGHGLSAVRIASVANFPDGSADVRRAVRETTDAIAAGADEVDLVLPYRALLAGETDMVRGLLRDCREAAGARCLKVILETGELGSAAMIAEASRIALEAGANFLKTSTGKAAVGATPQAAQIMLAAIARHGSGGFKAAGGIRRVTEVLPYLELADALFGPGWATPARFRIGASALLQDVLAVLDGLGETPGSDGY